jgi:hypothetical protein
MANLLSVLLDEVEALKNRSKLFHICRDFAKVPNDRGKTPGSLKF